MASGMIDGVIGQSAFDQVKAMEEALAKLTVAMTQAAETAAKIKIGLKGQNDIPGLVKQMDDVKQASGNVANALSQVDKIKKQIATNTERNAALEGELGKAYASSTVALREKNKALTDAAKAQTQATKAKQAEKQAILEATQQRKIDIASAREAAEVQKAVAEATKRATQAHMDEVKNSRANEAQAKKLQQSIAKLTAERDKEAANAAKSANAYEQLKAEYTQAANAAKQLGAEYYNLQRSGTATQEQLMTMGTAARAANTQALALSKGLYEIERSVGQSQRNVGNYNALMFETNQIMRELPNFALSARTGLMSLSNNLPMFASAFSDASRRIDDATGRAVGFRGALRSMGKAIFSWQGLLIAGITILLQYGPAIGDFISGLFNAKKKIDDLAQQIEITNEIQKKAIKNYAEETAKIIALKSIIEDTTLSRKQRNNAVDEYNDLADESNKIDKKSIDNGAYIEATLSRQIELIKKRGLARAAESVIAEKAETVFSKQLELEEKYPQQSEAAIKSIYDNAEKRIEEYAKKAGVTVSNADDLIKVAFMPDATLKQMADGSDKYSALADKNIRKIAKDAADQLKLIQRYRENAFGGKTGLKELVDEIADAEEELNNAIKSGQQFIGGASLKSKTKTTNSPDNTNRDLSIDTSMVELNKDLYIQLQKEQMAHNKAMYEDETLSLQDRLNAYQAYVNNKIDISRAESGQTVQEAQMSLDKIAELEQISAGKRTKQQNDLIAKKEFFTKQITLLTEQQASKEGEILEGASSGQTKIIESNIKKQIAIIRSRYSEIKNEGDAELTYELYLLSQKKEQGLITDKEYWKERQKLYADESKKIYEQQAAFITAEYEKIINDPTIPDAIKKFVEDLMGHMQPVSVPKQEKSILDLLGFGKKSEAERREEIKKSIEGLYDTIFQAIDQARENYYQQRFDQLDAEKQKVEDNAAAEKAAIESSLMSQEQKDKKLAELDAKKAAKEKSLDTQRSALKRKQAVAEKNDAMLKIALDGAVSIAKAFANYGWPAGIVVAALAAAQTAAQLALVASQPIPQYWQGTGDHIGGLAVVGERGAELVNLPSGKSFLTPDKPTLMDLPKHTEVINNKELVSNALLNSTIYDRAINSRDLIREYGVSSSTQSNYMRSQILAKEAQRMAVIKMGIMQQQRNIPPDNSNGMIAVYEQQTSKLINAIVNKREVHFSWRNGELIKSVKNGNSISEYIDGAI